jgi:hypothetical protein
MVAEDNIVRFERFSDNGSGFGTRVPAGMVYAAQRLGPDGEEHDGRGLIIAILLCMACWAALGYFLLA